MATTPRTARAALLAAILTAALWAADAVSIGVGGGAGDNIADFLLFLAGLACFLFAAVSLGLAWTAGRPTAVRAGVAVLAPLMGFALGLAVDTALRAVLPTDHSWVWGEVNLWVTAALLLVLAWVQARRTA